MNLLRPSKREQYEFSGTTPEAPLRNGAFVLGNTGGPIDETFSKTQLLSNAMLVSE